MPLESDSDRLAFLTTFGAQITVNSASVYAIFDKLYAEDLDVASEKATALCRTIDVSSTQQGTSVVVNAINYQVANREDDGQGMTLLVLEKQ